MLLFLRLTGLISSVKNVGFLGTTLKAGRPVLEGATKLGKGALGVGSSILKGVGSYLSPTVVKGVSTVAKTGGGILGKMLPGVGAALSVYTAFEDFQKGDMLGVVTNGVAAVTNFIPVVGPLVSGILTFIDMFRKGELTALFDSVKNVFISVTNYVSEKISGITSWFSSIGDKIYSSITGLGNSFMSGITSFTGSIWSGLASTLDVTFSKIDRSHIKC